MKNKILVKINRSIHKEIKIDSIKKEITLESLINSILRDYINKQKYPQEYINNIINEMINNEGIEENLFQELHNKKIIYLDDNTGYYMLSEGY